MMCPRSLIDLDGFWIDLGVLPVISRAVSSLPVFDSYRPVSNIPFIGKVGGNYRVSKKKEFIWKLQPGFKPRYVMEMALFALW